MRKYILCIVLLLSCSLCSMGQKFFNLTAEEVRIDSMLPVFTHSVPLGAEYADSVYTVSIEYAEFIDMSREDVDRYMQISGKPLKDMPDVTQRVVVERKKGRLEISFVPLVYRKGKYRKLVSFMLGVKAKPLKKSQRRARAATPSERYAAHSVLATGRWAKIRVPETGIYQLTDAVIRRAGFSNLSKVRIYGYGGALQNERITEEDIIKYDDLKEVPTCTIEGRRLFHAQGPVTWKTKTATERTRNPYSDYGYYLITQGDDEPLSVDSAAFVDSFYPSYDDYHALREVDNFAWFQGGRNLFEATPIQFGDSASYAMVVPVDGGEHTRGTISVALTAGKESSSTVAEVWLGDRLLGTQRIGGMSKYDEGGIAKATYSVERMLAKDTVTIKTIMGGPVRLDYISVYHETPRPLPDISRASFPAPEYVYNITNQDLHGDGAYDMVIIVPASGKLNEQAKRLKEYHEKHDGLRVRMVPADEVYNEFSSGTPDANAYRRYMKMLYDRASTEADMPRYLLLFGDCVWDNRMNTAALRGVSPDDYLLCFESENSFSYVDCYVDDGFFCLLDDGEGANVMTSDKHDIAVGRFPVSNEHDAKTLVDKTIAYMENKNAGVWQNVVMFMGDDGNENIHMIGADNAAKVVESLNPGLHVKRVMWDSYARVSSATGNSYPDVMELIKAQQAAGALVMDYCGHGGPNQISHERVLSVNDFANFSNTNYPLWITASCDIMPFDGTVNNIGEAALLNAKGGTMAFFGTTRTVYTDRNERINKAFLRALFTKVNGKYVSIGDAQRIAKNSLITAATEAEKDLTVNKLQYSLLGDPALVLNIPELTAVVDRINGVPVDDMDTEVTLSAGGLVSVSGHIERGGEVCTDFNGTLTANVRDSEVQVVCRLNDTSGDGASTKFEYYDRTKSLFNGRDSVRSGLFDFSFSVPMDINYSGRSGLINLFAVNNDNTLSANGYCESFAVGGTENAKTDSIGPSIYCYLNSPSFSNGGNVNTTPYFVAQIRDKDGINTTGNGVGHDLQLTIDGDMSKTYILNENFTYDFGSYTSGTTFYSIPELAPGRHKLRFRAWDIMNNSSTAELTFNVVSGLTPGLFSIGCTDNPACTSTTFIVNHDRYGSNMDVEIEVFDISGRPLWKHKENGVSPIGAYTVDWNLVKEDGNRLSTGIYLYRVQISSNGSSKASKARKLIVIE